MKRPLTFMRIQRMFRLLAVALMGLALIVLAACGNQGAETNALPDFVRESPPRVREAYTYAMNHPEELENYPCYCGCGAMGHTSNLSCYISDIAADGAVTFDDHASGCGICVDITQDVMRLRGEGRSAAEVRAYIDATYSSFGPGTDTPLP